MNKALSQICHGGYTHGMDAIKGDISYKVSLKAPIVTGLLHYIMFCVTLHENDCISKVFAAIEQSRTK